MVMPGSLTASMIDNLCKHWIRYFNRLKSLVIALLTLTTSCSQPNEPIRTVQIQQTWQLQPGDKIAAYQVVAGLGDVSIALNGHSVYAPFAGRVQPNLPNCVIFSSPDLPAYLLRLCGLDRPKLGQVQQREAIGSGSYLHFATLRKEQEGTWSMVEPARHILEQMLTKP
jgi:hypothetical protein